MADDLESRTAEDVLGSALERFHPRIALAASFGAEDMVIIDMLARLEPTAHVFTLDTGRLPPETYRLIDTVSERYGLLVEVRFPRTDAVEQMVREHGVNLFYSSVDNRRRCCNVRKVEPLGRALVGLDAWITGLRHDQVPTRVGLRKIEVDQNHGGIFKVNPLADWTWDEVWAYIRAHDVPYNALHDRGYPSIGCAPCTRATRPGEDLRAGRWWWESAESKECGLHGVHR